MLPSWLSTPPSFVHIQFNQVLCTLSTTTSVLVSLTQFAPNEDFAEFSYISFAFTVYGDNANHNSLRGFWASCIAQCLPGRGFWWSFDQWRSFFPPWVGSGSDKPGTHTFTRVCGSHKPGTHTFTRVCGSHKPGTHRFTRVYGSDKPGTHRFIGVWGHKLLEVWVPLPRGHEFKWGFQTFTIAGGSIGFTGDYPLDKNEDNARLLVLSCMEGSLLEKASAYKGPALLAVTVQRKLRSSCEEG